MRQTVCHGYANCCECKECTEQSERVSPAFRRWLESTDEMVRVPRLLKRQKKAAQPWQARKAA